jgi:hypothetical protein
MKSICAVSSSTTSERKKISKWKSLLAVGREGASMAEDLPSPIVLGFLSLLLKGHGHIV